MGGVAARLRAATQGLPGAFWTLWAGLLVNRVATFVVAFLAPYLVRERGVSAVDAGRIVALYGLGVTVAGPLGGVLADRVGRRRTMLLALVLGAGSAAALAFARSLPLLALLAFLCAATADMYRPALAAAVADLVPPADRARAFGLVYWAVNLALSLGMLLGAAVATRSLAALFLLDAATSVACALLIAARVPETRPAATVHSPALQGLTQVAGDGPFVAFLLLYLAGLVVFGQWQLGLPVDMAAHGFGPSAYAVLMALNCGGVVLLQPLLAPRLRLHDGAHLLALMAALFGLGYGVNAVGGSLLVYGVGTALWTVGEVLGFPVSSALVADLAPPALRGRYQGAFSMTAGLSLTLAPIMGGELYGRFGGPTLWLTCLAVGGAVAAGHLAVAPARRRRLAASRAAALGT